MSGFLIAVPQGVPDQPSAPSKRLLHRFLAGDGSVWDFCDPQRSFFRRDGQLVGLAEEPFERLVSSSPARPGVRRRGTSWKERPVSWPLWVREDLLGPLLRAVSGELVGVWEVTHVDAGPDHQVRLLSVTGGSSGPWAMQGMDLARSGTGVRLQLDLVAEDPRWRGEPVFQDWSAQVGEPFFGGSDGGGFGPPFVISSDATFAAAVLPNRGDWEAWPTWTVEGIDDADPVTSVRLGVGGSYVGASGLSLGAGESMVVDCDPLRQSTVVNGSRVRGLLTEHDFAPLPAAASVPLSIEVVGQARVRAQIVPTFKTALL